MISNKLRVGGLSRDTNELGLRNAFGRFGDVVEAEVVLDGQTERSRGFGFVTMVGTTAANTAMCALDGSTLDGRSIRVTRVDERPHGVRHH